MHLNTAIVESTENGFLISAKAQHKTVTEETPCLHQKLSVFEAAQYWGDTPPKYRCFFWKKFEGRGGHLN